VPPGRQQGKATPTSAATRRKLLGLSVAAIGVGAVVLIAGRSLWRPPDIELVIPGQLDEFTPEFRRYAAQFVDHVREAPNDAARHALLGTVFEANVLWAAAQTCYRNALQLEPDHKLARYHLAIVTEKLGDAPAALELYRETTERHPDFAPAFHRLGDLLLESGELDRASKAFEQVTKLEPQSIAGYVGLTNVKLRARDFHGAVELIEDALVLQPKARQPHYQLGLAYRGLGRLDEAERELEYGQSARKLYLPDEWSRQLPRHETGLTAQLRLDEARDYLEAGAVDQAAERLEYALQWHPGDVKLLNELGTVYLRLNEPAKACEKLLEAKPFDSSNPHLFANLAACQALLDRLDEALRYADRAVALAPDLSESHLSRGRVFMRMARFDDALAEFEKAASLDSSSALPPLEMGNVHLVRGEYRKAKEQYESAVERDPASLEVRVRLCAVCVRMGELEEAHVQLAAAKEIAPLHPMVATMAAELRKVTK